MGLLDKLFGFTNKEKLNHYTKVAKGEKDTKHDSKFSEAEQRAYARGQRDARNEARSQYKWKNSSADERLEYEVLKAERRKGYKDAKKQLDKKNGK